MLVVQEHPAGLGQHSRCAVPGHALPGDHQLHDSAAANLR